MKLHKIVIYAIPMIYASSLFASGTEEEVAQIEANLNAPIDCRTSEADIRVLKSEKAHTAEQAAKGVTSIVPIGAVINVVQGDEDESLKISTGHYDRLIDDKIAKIEEKCPHAKN